MDAAIKKPSQDLCCFRNQDIFFDIGEGSGAGIYHGVSFRVPILYMLKELIDTANSKRIGGAFRGTGALHSFLVNTFAPMDGMGSGWMWL